jgi:hypothetical protein
LRRAGGARLRQPLEKRFEIAPQQRAGFGRQLRHPRLDLFGTAQFGLEGPVVLGRAGQRPAIDKTFEKLGLGRAQCAHGGGLRKGLF